MFIDYPSKWFSLDVTTMVPVPVANDLIRSQNIFTKFWLIYPCPRQGTEKLDVYSERQPSHD